MIIDVPEGQDPIIHVWGEMVPGIGIRRRDVRPGRLRPHHARAARVRGGPAADRPDQRLPVLPGLAHRARRREGRGLASPTRSTGWRTTGDLDDRARLAAEYAERYALDHHGLDDEFWTRMKAHYTDAEIVELSMCLGSWLSFGRLNRVLGLDTACVLPAPPRPTRRPTLDRAPPQAPRLRPCRATSRSLRRVAHRPAARPRPGGARRPRRRSSPGRRRRGARPAGAPPGMLGAAHKPGRDAAAAADARRHVRRRVPDHPLQPEGDRRLGGAGRRGRDGDPGPAHRGAHRARRPLARTAPATSRTPRRSRPSAPPARCSSASCSRASA